MQAFHALRADSNLNVVSHIALGSGWHDYNIILGAFAGSIIFIVSAEDFIILARLALFTAAITIGVTSAEFTAILFSFLLNRLLQITILIPVPLGATIAAAVSVRCLIYLSSRSLQILTAGDNSKKGDE